MGKFDDKYKPRLRDIKYTERIKTRICLEEASKDNPYVTESLYFHGYNVLDLMSECGFIDVLYLLIRGELPNTRESKLLETLMIGLSNPGPRHPATRAAINVGIGKTDIAHLLPISLSVLSGSYLGGGEVEASMRFIKRHDKQDPKHVADTLIKNESKPMQGDWHIIPGFGSRFGSIDIVIHNMVKLLLELPQCGDSLSWCDEFVKHLMGHKIGWLSTGLAASVFVDLGLHPRYGPGLYQLLCAPGILAQGLEFANKPITELPFIDDEHYIIEK